VTAVVNSTVTVGVAEIMNGSKFIDNWTSITHVIVSIFFIDVVTIIEVILVRSQESTMSETVGRCSFFDTVATAIARVVARVVAIAIASVGSVAIASIGLVAIASIGIVAIASIGIVAIASTIAIATVATIATIATVATIAIVTVGT